MSSVEPGPLFLNRRANVPYARAGAVHLSRFRGDVDADRALKAVRLPGRHIALVVSRRDETVVVAAMAAALAAAEARNVAENLGMFRGEYVRGANDIDWTRWREFL